MQNAPQQPAPPEILVSMCVLGHPVRYNGSARTAAHAALERWQREGRLVPVCPELAGGLNVPRPPAEIAGGASGQHVLKGVARIVDVHGTDVTAALLREHGVEVFADTGIDALVARLAHLAQRTEG